MSLPRLFIKASAPIFSIFLILAGIIQLRAQMWTLGILCILQGRSNFLTYREVIHALGAKVKRQGDFT